ncbi:hypothetical protein, partial [Klebsiella pneumoniae]
SYLYDFVMKKIFDSRWEERNLGESFFSTENGCWYAKNYVKKAVCHKGYYVKYHVIRFTHTLDGLKYG